jgi:hypothetical protein
MSLRDVFAAYDGTEEAVDGDDLLAFARPHPLPPTPLPSRVPSPTFSASRDPTLSLESLTPNPWDRSRGPLHPGALWVGTQKSGRASFMVSVRVLSVDLPAGYLYVSLSIYLFPSPPVLTRLDQKVRISGHSRTHGQERKDRDLFRGRGRRRKVWVHHGEMGRE